MRIQAASYASSEVLSVLQAEEGADSVQVLGDCEGAGSAGKASTEAFKQLQQSTQMPKVMSGGSLEVTLCFSISMCVTPQQPARRAQSHLQGTWPRMVRKNNVIWAVALLTASLIAILLQVILMCSSEETGQAELQLLTQVQDALKASAQPHVMVYATQPHAGEASPIGRSLLAVGRKSRREFVCDAPCQAQVSRCHASVFVFSIQGHHLYQALRN